MDKSGHSVYVNHTIMYCLPISGVLVIVADLAFCYLDNAIMALLCGVGVGVAGLYLPMRLHRIPHESGWHNPAFMGAMLTEMVHTALCYFIRILPNIL